MIGCNYLISKGANLVQIDKSEESIMKTLIERAPRAMTTFLQERLDNNLHLEKEQTKIELNFSKIFGSGSSKEEESRKQHEMMLFRELARAPEPFRSYVEHPLCQAFVSFKFRHVKYLFWLFSLIPHLIFSGRKIIQNIFLASSGD